MLRTTKKLQIRVTVIVECIEELIKDALINNIPQKTITELELISVNLRRTLIIKRYITLYIVRSVKILN